MAVDGLFGTLGCCTHCLHRHAVPKTTQKTPPVGSPDFITSSPWKSSVSWTVSGPRQVSNQIRGKRDSGAEILLANKQERLTRLLVYSMKRMDSDCSSDNVSSRCETVVVDSRSRPGQYNGRCSRVWSPRVQHFDPAGYLLRRWHT